MRYGTVTSFSTEIDKDVVRQTSLEIPLKSFIPNKLVEGKAYMRTHKIQDPNAPKRRPGRPKGSKDRKKPQLRHNQDTSLRVVRMGNKTEKVLRNTVGCSVFIPNPSPCSSDN